MNRSPDHVHGFESVLLPSPLDDSLSAYVAGALQAAVVLSAYLSNGTLTREQFLVLCAHAFDAMDPREVEIMRQVMRSATLPPSAGSVQ